MSYKEERALENYPQALHVLPLKYLINKLKLIYAKFYVKLQEHQVQVFFVKYLFQIY